jgi:hypothetical protein
MEPKLPAPNLGPERQPGGYGQNLEQIPLPPNPENAIERAPERVEQRSEATPAAVNAQPVLPAPVVLPEPVTPVADDTNTQASDNGMPLVAHDDDLIEKEWVDKAKKIIVQTKDDPYAREREVGKLQADYLRKRYGKELGVPE